MDSYRARFLATTAGYNSPSPHRTVSIPRNVLQRLFQLQSKRFAVPFGSFTRDAHRFFKNHFAARKRQWNLKSVPAFHADFAVEIKRDGHDGEPGELRECDDAFLHHVTRAA